MTTVQRMRANVALSQGHVAKQERIIAQLARQGHDGMERIARDVLVTMHRHLAMEIEMLDRMVADPRDGYR